MGNKAVRNMRLPFVTRRAVVLAFALSAVAWFVPGDSVRLSLLAVNALWLIAVIVDSRLAPSPAKVKVEREFPEVVGMGSKAELLWHVQNPRSRAFDFELADHLASSLRAEQRRLAARVPGSGRVTVGTTIQPSRRGRFLIGELVVRTYGPLGLAARQVRRSDARAQLRIYPPFESRKQAELRIERARIAEVGMRSVRSRGGGTEFDQLREYSVDDDPRRIDWFATARSNRPIVRTFRAEQNQNVMLLMDCGRVMAGKVSGWTRLEHAMDAAMAMSTVVSRLGDRVGLVAFDQAVRAEVGLGQGSAQVTRVTEALYGLQPSIVESDYKAAFVRMMARARRRCMVIVLTEHATGATDETLLPALPLVARDHLVVVAGVRDPDVTSWARSVPSEASMAHRKTAAITSLRERSSTLARLNAMGAVVVDAEPGKLAGVLADTYLEVKAAGRL